MISTAPRSPFDKTSFEKPINRAAHLLVLRMKSRKTAPRFRIHADVLAKFVFVIRDCAVIAHNYRPRIFGATSATASAIPPYIRNFLVSADTPTDTCGPPVMPYCAGSMSSGASPA